MAEHPDVDGFDAFYAGSFHRLVRVVRPWVGADAEDVAQEALLVARHRWPEVRTLDRPEAWVRRVALRMGGRRARRERDRSAMEAAATPLPATAAPDLDLAAAVLGLPDRYAAAIRLHHLEDRPIAELAERFGCTEGAARVLLHRARRVLSERLVGLTGRWVSDATLSPDAVVRYLRSVGWGSHVGAVLDDDMGGRGGRFELTIADGSYRLGRDDGQRFDHGASRTDRWAFEMSPELAHGRARYRASIVGRRLSLELLETSINPSRGMPDEIWVRMFYETAPFSRAEGPDKRP